MWGRWKGECGFREADSDYSCFCISYKLNMGDDKKWHIKENLIIIKWLFTAVNVWWPIRIFPLVRVHFSPAMTLIFWGKSSNKPKNTLYKWIVSVELRLVLRHILQMEDISTVSSPSPHIPPLTSQFHTKITFKKRKKRKFSVEQKNARNMKEEKLNAIMILTNINSYHVLQQ